MSGRCYTLSKIGNKITSKINKIESKNKYYNLFSWVDVYDEGRTYVKKSSRYWGGKFDIIVSLTDIDDYCNSTGIDDGSATKYLVSHEILHVLLDHFNPKYQNYNHKLFNIACDLEVNSYINMQYPALRAKDYGWPDMLTADEYYQKLLKMYEEEKELMEEEELYNPNNMFGSGDEEFSDMFGDFESTENLNSSNKSDTEPSSNSDKDNEVEHEEKNSSSNNTSSEDDKYLDEFIQNNFGDNQYNNNVEKSLDEEDDSLSIQVGNSSVARFGEAITKAMEKGFSKIEVKGLDKVIRTIEKKEKSQIISPHTRKQTFTKLNNRRKNGNLILPGKRLEEDGVRKRFDNSAVAFFDVSGSTCDIINTINVSAQRLHKSGVNIVFYDSWLLDEIEVDKPFRVQSSQGGTNIENCLKQYFEKHNINKLERVYIFTDGEDDFSNLKNIIDKFKVFYIEGKEVFEVLSEKDNIPTERWAGWHYFQDKVRRMRSKRYA